MNAFRGIFVLVMAAAMTTHLFATSSSRRGRWTREQHGE